MALLRFRWHVGMAHLCYPIKQKEFNYMKKKYLNVEIELISLTKEDIVTLSQSGDNFIEDDWN